MSEGISRRRLLSTGALALGGVAAGALTADGALTAGGAAAAKEPQAKAFPISLNTSTLRGHKLNIGKVIDLAVGAGYDGIEPWPDELDRYVRAGGTLKDLGKRLKDEGLKVTGAIAFFRWMVDDATQRRKALEEARERMDMLSQIGASHIAAPPAGDVGDVDLLAAAERYRDLLEVSESFGVTPALEIWGSAKNLYRLGQCALVALEARHPKACILPDVYHLYKGGSGLGGVRLLSGACLGGFHFNDYPANPPRESMRDSDRIYPGDGIAPLEQLFRDLRDIGYHGAVSVELFNRTYYAQDPALVAKTALEKTRTVMRKALGS